MLLEELIHERENGERYIESYELHEYLQVKTAHNVWINNRVKKCGFNEYRDYISAEKFLSINNPKNPTTKIKNYEMTLRMAVELCTLEKQSENAGRLLDYLIKDIKVLTIHTYSRFEISFRDKLINTLKPLNIKIETQKSMKENNYRIDFYLPEFNLAIEYDEEQHKYQQEEDKQREEEIKEVLGCKFIRLDYKQDDCYNVGLVLKEIMGR